MKRRSGLGIAIGGLAAVALSGAALAFSGPTNASFETGTYVDNGFGFEQLNAGDTSIDGWTVDAGSVDWVGTYWPAQDGSMSIDMSGLEPGTLSQTFATTIGNTYTVSFYLSGNPAGPPDGEDARRQRDGRNGGQLLLRREREHPVQHELDAGDVLLPCDGHEHHAQLRQHDAGPIRPRPRQRRRDRNRPHQGRLQARWLADDDRRRRQPLQEPGRLRQLLRHERQEPGGAAAGNRAGQARRTRTTTSRPTSTGTRTTTRRPTSTGQGTTTRRPTSTGPRATTPRTRSRTRRTLPMGRIRSIRNSRSSPSTVGPFGSPKGPINLRAKWRLARGAPVPRVVRETRGCPGLDWRSGCRSGLSPPPSSRGRRSAPPCVG